MADTSDKTDTSATPHQSWLEARRLRSIATFAS